MCIIFVYLTLYFTLGLDMVWYGMVTCCSLSQYQKLQLVQGQYGGGNYIFLIYDHNGMKTVPFLVLALINPSTTQGCTSSSTGASEGWPSNCTGCAICGGVGDVVVKELASPLDRDYMTN